MIVVPTTYQLLQLAAIKAAMLDLGTLHLFQNDITPTPLTVIGDLVEADFDGYAAVAITAFEAPFLDPQNLATVYGILAMFQATGATTPNQIFGAYFVDVNTDLAFVYRFPQPIQIAAAGNAVPVVPKYQFGPLAS